jgi:hypothetical protein
MSRRTGHIARLPFEIRTGVNTRLQDGLTYGAVVAWLAEQGHVVSEKNVENWAKPDATTGGCGYQDWLSEQQRLADMQRRREFALQVAKSDPELTMQGAASALASDQMFDLLSGVDVEALRTSASNDPAAYTALLNAVARLNTSSAGLARYQAEVKATKERIEKEIAASKGKGGITRETLERIERELKLL